MNAVLADPFGLFDYYGGGGGGGQGPSAPTSVSGSARCGGISIQWGAPTSDGGNPVTGYVVWVRSGGQVVTTDFVGPNTFSDKIFGLTNGTTYDVTVSATNIVSVGPESAPPVHIVPSCISTTLTYTGGQYVIAGNALNVSATLTSPSSSCMTGQPITFSFDTNPITQAAGNFPLASGTTNSSGQTGSISVSTAGWQDGVYLLTANFAGTQYCAPAQDVEAVTVATAADAASGGGFITDNGRTSFGFVVHLVPKTTSTYKGEFIIMNNGKWKMKGTLSSYVNVNGVGTSTGTGTLYFQTSTGGWQLAGTNVGVTLQFTASGSGKKSSPGSLGIQIAYTPVPPQPSQLPNIGLTPLKGGHIGTR